LKQICVLLAGMVCLCGALAAKDYDDPFILREHLTTKSPYFPLGSYSEYTNPPDGCKAIYLNFVARSVRSALTMPSGFHFSASLFSKEKKEHLLQSIYRVCSSYMNALQSLTKRREN
jgi:hypothetical protein